MKLLIDTNIFIPLEPTSSEDVSGNTPLVAELSQLASQTKCDLWLHPAQQVDIANDNNPERLAMRIVLFSKYPVLPIENAIAPDGNTNDWVDDQLIEAVRIGAVSGLVTEDRKLIRKANRILGSGKIFNLLEAITVLRTMRGIPPQPLLEALPKKTFNLDPNDSFWDSFKHDYVGFEQWLEKVRLDHRDCWVIEGEPGKLAGALIVKWEGKTNVGEKTLKICSFKVDSSFGGRKYGELLLKTVFKYCLANEGDALYVTVFPHHVQLIQLLTDFGFYKQGDADTGEEIFSKVLISNAKIIESPENSLERFIQNGPHYAEIPRKDILVIPVLPVYHDLLFPEFAEQKALLTPITGNTLRKVYISKAPRKNLRPGSILLFYRSRASRDILAWGVLEETLCSRSVDEICAFVMPRTVYSRGEIEEMCETGGVTAIMFRQGLIEPKNPLKFSDLVGIQAIGGYPQSITRLKEAGAKIVESWLS
ncbi:MAG: GNAT family N-acetyltransferase [Fimbriimonadaceae bacterium]